jgi:hypothetical protein
VGICFEASTSDLKIVTVKHNSTWGGLSAQALMKHRLSEEALWQAGSQIIHNKYVGNSAACLSADADSTRSDKKNVLALELQSRYLNTPMTKHANLTK